MYKVNSNTPPTAFHELFKRATQKYPTALSKSNYMKREIYLIKSKYRISFRGHFIWSTFLGASEKNVESFPLFYSKVKTKLLDHNDTIDFF